MVVSVTRRAFSAGLALAAMAGAARAQQLVAVRAADGVTVGGRSYGSGRRGVVLVPGGHGVGETWHLQAQRLAGAGFHVFAIDYRGLGGLPGKPDDTKTHLDVLGAVHQLSAAGADQIAVVGASWGGRAAGLAAILAPKLIDRLVLLAPSEIDTPERLGGRKLFIVASGDRDGSGRLRLDTIRKQYDRAPAPKELVILPGDAHAQFLFLTAQGDRLYAEILRFLSAK